MAQRETLSRSSRSRQVRTKRGCRAVRFSVPADPFTYNERPWNSQIVELKVKPTAENPQINYTVKDLLKSTMAAFSGIVKETELEVRLFSIRVWNLTGGSIFLQPFQFTTQDTPQSGGMRSLVDYPGRNKWARVGFHWPPQQTNIVLETPTSAEVLYTIGSTSPNTELLVYMQIKWRFNTASLPNYFRV